MQHITVERRSIIQFVEQGGGVLSAVFDARGEGWCGEYARDNDVLVLTFVCM